MASRTLPLHIDFDRVARFCRKHRIVRLSLSGSALREAYDPARRAHWKSWVKPHTAFHDRFGSAASGNSTR